MSIFKKNKTIYNSQFGFQQDKSTEHAILDLYANVIQSIVKQEKSSCISLDFAKAFDTVDNKIFYTKKARLLQNKRPCAQMV